MIPDDDVALGQNTEYDDNSTFYNPGTPEGQDERIAEENRAKAASYPILGDVYEWFDHQVNVTNSIEQAHLTLEQYNAALAKGKPSATMDDVLVAHDIVRMMLEHKREEFKEFRVEK